MKAFTTTCMLTLLALSVAAAEPELHRWHLLAAVLDASTGAVLQRTQALNADGKPLIYADAQSCVDAAVNVKPMRRANGVVIALGCVRDDVLPAD